LFYDFKSNGYNCVVNVVGYSIFIPPIISMHAETAGMIAEASQLVEVIGEIKSLALLLICLVYSTLVPFLQGVALHIMYICLYA
jgi:hypothetical protein